MGNIDFFLKEFQEIKLMFYDLGLENVQATKIKGLPFTTFRKFDFSKYLRHIKLLLENDSYSRTFVRV